MDGPQFEFSELIFTVRTRANRVRRQINPPSSPQPLGSTSMSQITKSSDQQMLLVLVAFSLMMFIAGCYKKSPPSEPSNPQPQAKEPAGPPPSAILAGRTLHNPPALTGSGDDARRAVAAFIDWAGASLPEEHEDGRKALAGARENRDVVTAFTEEITKAQRTDHSRALLALALLGEMRSLSAEEFLVQFVNQPFPQEGIRTEEGEILEQNSLGQLQAKAVDGLAYLRSPRADEEVLKQVKDHPSIIVRSEAIGAYLWNQTDKAAARRTLLQYVRKGEERYLDQITRQEGERAGSFNPKLEAYLKAHPEVAPPNPERLRQGESVPDQVTKPGAPPKQ